MQLGRERMLNEALGLFLAVAASVVSGCSDPSVTSPDIRRSFSAQLEASQFVTLGDSLALTFRVKNSRSEWVGLPLAINGDLAFDPIVRDSLGREVWRRLAGQLIAGAVEIVGVPANGEKVFAATWNLRDENQHLVPPGNYFINGRLLLENGDTLVAQNIALVTISQK
jgi:hypothetical protein